MVPICPLLLSGAGKGVCRAEITCKVSSRGAPEHVADSRGGSYRFGRFSDGHQRLAGCAAVGDCDVRLLAAVLIATWYFYS